jgi:glycosyltransferase involved in cell wall biosynthesis
MQRLTLVLLKRFHNKTGCTMVPTAQMAAELASYGFERTCVLSRGVDTQLFDPARRSMELRRTWSVGPDDPVVLYAGRLAAEKNIGLAVDAYRRVKQKTANARMVVVGDGPIRQQLQQANPDFFYAGYRRGEDLAAHYASADVMLFPSLTETFGNVVTEAMASGLVTVAFDTAAAREHVRTGVNGVTVPVDRPDLFITSALEMTARQEAWKPIREAARRTAQGISWESVITDFECHLSDVREAHAAEAGQPVKQNQTVTA